MIEAQNTLLPNGLERFLVRGKMFCSEMATQFPAVAAGIQVIHCKNPKCANFGVSPNAAPSHPLGRPTKGTVLATPKPGDYLLSVRGRGAGSSLPYLYCALCGESIPMQSNLAIEEELVRISAYLEPAVGPACRNEECECVGVPLPAAPENRRADYVNAVLDKGINWEFALRNVG